MRRAEAGIQVDKFYPPTDWLDNNNKQIDIRKNAENNSIVLLVGHIADFSKYSLLGLLADTSSGTYDVYIDDVLVGSGITKNTQYDIDFSTINTSYGSATTPEVLVLHKIVVKPNTSGATITAFHCARTTGVSTAQEQGVLWCHLELNNQINIAGLLGTNYPYNYKNRRNQALTAKGDYINNTTNTNAIFCYNEIIRYVCELENGSGTLGYYLCGRLKRIRVNNQNINQTYQFSNNQKLEQINIKNKSVSSKSIQTQQFYVCYQLKMLPFNKSFGGSSGSQWIHQCNKLFPTKIDLSDNKNLTLVGVYGTTAYLMRGLRGLKVSNEAPFSGSSPQINVSYTGLDRDALVELFQSLPTVTGGQTLSLVGATGNNLTKVGSPTIDENGVASGFSTSDYLRCGQIPNTKIVEYNIKIKTGTIGNIERIFGESGSTSYGGLSIVANGKLSFSLKRLSGYTDIPFDITLLSNTIYTINIKFEEGIIRLFVYDENGNKIYEEKKEVSYTEQLAITVCFGMGSGTRYFSGIIYLEETYIKEFNNFIMKGYLTDTDKNIALNKGWALTLS